MVKLTKYAVLAFGALGVVSLFLPGDDGRSMLGHAIDDNKVATLFLVAGFGVPLLMGALGLVKPPFRAWQAVAALAGFSMLAVKFQLWVVVPQFADAVLALQLFISAAIGGIVVSAFGAAKPEGE
jgi:hypothetical protein